MTRDSFSWAWDHFTDPVACTGKRAMLKAG